MSAFTIPSIFTAVDKFSAPVRKMTETAVLMADKINTSMARAERSFRNVGKSAKEIGRNAGIFGAAVLAPLVIAGKAAVDFEDKMADVAKIANVTIGSNEFVKLGESAQTLGVALGVGAKEAAGLLANLAQGGVAINDLDRVAMVAGKVGVAFGISADIAGEAFVKTKNALGGTIESTELLMDTINTLGNTMAASSEQILTFMSSGGSGVARALGDSGKAVSAVGAQFIAMGKSAEESATIMEAFTRTTLKTKEFKSTFDKAGGGAAGMLAVIEKGYKLSGKKQDEYFSKFGKYGLSLQLLGKNFESLKGAVDIATDAEKNNNSVLNEFNNRTNTTAFKLKVAKAQFENLSIVVGNEVIPIVLSLLEKIKPIITSIIDWVSKNRELVKTIVTVIAFVGGLALVISGVAFVVAALTKLFILGKIALVAYNIVVGISTALQGKSAFFVMGNAVAYGAYRTAVIAGTAAQWLLNAALNANPIGLIIIAVAALIALIAVIIKKWNEWGAALSLFLGPLGFIISLIQSFRRNWDMIVEAFKTDGILGGLKAIGKTILDAILMPLQQLLEITASITGFDWAAEAAASISKFRAEMGVNVTTDESGNALSKEAVNPKKSEQDALVQKIEGTQTANVNVKVLDKNNRTEVTKDEAFVRILTGSTMNPFGV